MSSIVFIPLFALTLCSYMYFADRYENKYFNLFVFIDLIIFSFILGVRTNFGEDQKNYMYLYMHQSLTYFEPIYAYMNRLFYSFQIPFQVLFITTAAIQFYFIQKATKMLKISYTWVIIFFFLFRHFGFFINGLRQAIAISILMCAIIVFFKKKYFYYILLILFASGFHKSSLIFLLVCPIAKLINISNRKYISIMFSFPLLFAFVFYNQIWDFILNILLYLSPILPAKYQILIEAFSLWKIELGSGLGVRLQIMGYVFLLPNLVFYAKKDCFFKYLFLIFYFGIIGKYFSGQNMNLGRLFFGMEYCGIFLFVFIATTINRKNILKLRNILFILGVAIYLILFIFDSAKGPNLVGPTPYVWDLDFSFKDYFHGGL